MCLAIRGILARSGQPKGWHTKLRKELSVGKIASIIFSAGITMFAAVSAHAQTPISTSFTYQGELASGGVPATGIYDIRFRLYDAAAAGNQVGTMLCSDNINVANGRFSVTLDFGPQFAGQKRFLEIEVRNDTGLACSNTLGFTLLSPRQELTGAPNSLFALSASTAATSSSATNASNLNGQDGTFYRNAANLTGVLADSRLSTNVAQLNLPQTFTSTRTFAVAPSFASAGGPPFLVSSSNLVSNLNADLLDGLDSSAFLQQVPNPLALSGTTSDAVVKGTNNSTALFSAGVRGMSTAASGATMGGVFESTSTAGRGLFATASASSGGTISGEFWNNSTAGIGISGWTFATTGTTYGGWFRTESTEGRALYARANATSGSTYGGYFDAASPDGRAVYGLASAATGLSWGGYFESSSTNGRGVQGMAIATSGSTFGGRFETASPNGRGVQGMATATTGPATGGRFETFSADGAGVVARAYSTSGGWGVHGISDAFDGRGVVGEATYPAPGATTYGVYGDTVDPNDYAVYAAGRFGASGTKAFRIDHPLDPEKKYLLHYCTESAEVLNTYSGTVKLDDAGEAYVEMPAYFGRINKDPRYLLTAIGAPMPMLHIASEIDEQALAAGEIAEPAEAVPTCSFRIAGGQPAAKVSWRVEAVRNDRWLRRYGAPVELAKEAKELGAYQSPELYDQPSEKGIRSIIGKTRQ